MSNPENISRKAESLRKEYLRAELTEHEAHTNPIDQFAVWFQQALNAEVNEVNAMSLATADAEGSPSVRIVLLKGFSEAGFRFFTNYESRKSQELEKNNKAALCFFWAALERQVRIEGSVKKLSREDSEAYFKKRPRESQIGAWASPQSSTVKSREELDRRFAEMGEKFEGKEIPMPYFWGGYVLEPEAIEFWQGRKGRMHDRIRYKKIDRKWQIKRLAP